MSRLAPLNALRAFEAAARHGRMTAAAAELGVTHGAVSRQVRHLEETLGVTLFAGPKNRLTLTEAGCALLPRLTAAFEQIDTAVRAVADTDEGSLDVSCLGTFMLRWLIPRLHRFNALHPNIDVRLSASDRPVEFDRSPVEVAIRVSRGEWPAGARVMALVEEQFGPVAAPSLIARLGLDHVDKLAGAPLLHARTRPNAWSDWATLAGWRSAETNGAGGTYEHFYFMLEAATAGLGVAIAPLPLAAQDLAAGRLVAPFGMIPSGLTYAALMRPRRNRKAERFCAWLAEEARTADSSSQQ
jgi:LysR family transcriptional regulator, glycine cleavage system transcriptional activator